MSITTAPQAPLDVAVFPASMNPSSHMGVTVSVPPGVPLVENAEQAEKAQTSGNGAPPPVETQKPSEPMNTPGGYYPPPPDRQCTAKSVRSGERCKRWAEIAGVCGTHGAPAPQTQIKKKNAR